MHIGIDARGIREGYKGGVGEYTRSILDNLSRDKESTYQILSSGFSAPLNALPHTMTGKHVRLSNKILNMSLKLRKRPYLNTFFDSQPDLIFMPNWNITSLSPEIPLVLTVHDLSFQIYPEVFSTRMQMWHHWMEPQSLLQRSNKIIAVSHSTKQDIINIYSIPPTSIDVIYPGIDQTFFQISSEKQRDFVRKKYKLPDQYILFLGTIEPRKNIQMLIKSFEKIYKYHSDLHLVIAGKNGWKYREIYHTIESSPIRKAIHTIGFIDSIDKPSIYQGSRVFVYPSLYEGFGFPPLEAMAGGVPTITSAVSSLPEIVQNAAIKVSPYDIEELAYYLHDILTDEAKAQNYSLQGQDQAQKFTWKTTVKQVVATFKSVI